MPRCQTCGTAENVQQIVVPGLEPEDDKLVPVFSEHVERYI
jgi:hypothetical protein